MPEIKRKVSAHYSPPPVVSGMPGAAVAEGAPVIPEVNSLSCADAALAYAEAGLFVGPVKTGTKNPGSLLGGKWNEQTTTDPEIIRRWYQKWPDAGVFLHTGPSKLVVFDLDKTENLSDLPEEISTSLRTGLFHRSRGTRDRGHYLFTTDERLGNSAGGFAAFGDVRAGNGVIIVSPTIHPETGVQYQWDQLGKVPALPSALRGLLRVGGPDAVEPLSDATLQAFIEKYSKGTAPERLRGPIHSFRKRVAEGESRHGALAGVLPWAFREVKEGVYSAKATVDEFGKEFNAVFAQQKDGQRRAPSPQEFENLVLWAAAQPAASELAETLWGMSEKLTRVHRWAQEKYITPWSLLGVGLLRALCAIPPCAVLPAIIGSSAPPNLFLGLVGESGTGKGLAESVAEEAFVLQEPAASDLYPGKPGSGEGIPKMFGLYRGRLGVVFEHTRALMSLPEIDSLKALFGRDSSTLSATLRELWSGETLGNDYSGVQNKVLIRKKRYRACMSVGIQPERGGPLFDDATGGLPQRFVFAATQDPHILQPTGDRQDLQPIVLPVWCEEDVWSWRERMGTTVVLEELTELKVPSFVITEVHAARDRKMRKQSGGLDGHRLLLQEKVALGFAVIHGKTHGFDPEHWEMAELFMAHSDSVRDEALSAMSDAARRQRDGKATAEGRAGVVRDEAADGMLRTRTRERILLVLSDLSDGKWMGGAELARKLSKPQKEMLKDIAAEMVVEGEILRKIATSGRTSGLRYRVRGQK